MRLTFARLADRRPVETLVERDDGVVFAMRGAGGGAELPHDLVHALVEIELRIADGIWGCVADGVVWNSMRHLSGRQPPHAAERSAAVKKERSAAVRRAEAAADLVLRLARGADVLRGETAATGLAPAQLDAAAAELRTAGRSWADLRPGATWTLEWSRPRSPGRRSRGRAESGTAASGLPAIGGRGTLDT